MSSHDYIRYLTSRVVEYMDTPKEERKRKSKGHWSSHWFGLLPFSLKLYGEKQRTRLEKRRAKKRFPVEQDRGSD